MAGIISSLKKLVAFVILTVVLAGITIAFFELFVAGPAKNLRGSLELLGTLSIVFAFALISIYLLTHFKRLLTPYIGLQTATITQYLLVLVALTVTAFIILGLFGATLSALLASAGIIQ